MTNQEVVARERCRVCGAILARDHQGVMKCSPCREEEVREKLNGPLLYLAQFCADEDSLEILGRLVTKGEILPCQSPDDACSFPEPCKYRVQLDNRRIARRLTLANCETLARRRGLCPRT